jgi:pyruvate dehydrogenase E2 component (dihydrolipoamide acetyltransferase)
VTQEVEAEADGVLLKIVVDSGEVEVGRRSPSSAARARTSRPGTAKPPKRRRSPRPRTPPRADAEPEQEGSPAEQMDDERERGREAAAATAEAATEKVADSNYVRPDGRVKASPLARRLAREQGIDLTQLQGMRARRADRGRRTFSAA